MVQGNLSFEIKIRSFLLLPHSKRKNFNSIFKEMRLLDIYLPHEPRLPMKLDPSKTAFCSSYNQIQERNYKETQCG